MLFGEDGWAFYRKAGFAARLAVIELDMFSGRVRARIIAIPAKRSDISSLLIAIAHRMDDGMIIDGCPSVWASPANRRRDFAGRQAMLIVAGALT